MSTEKKGPKEIDVAGTLAEHPRALGVAIDDFGKDEEVAICMQHRIAFKYGERCQVCASKGPVQ